MQSIDLNGKITEDNIDSSNACKRDGLLDSEFYKSTAGSEPRDEVAELRQQVVDLNETMVRMVAAAEQKDKQAESLRRDNDRLSSELKKQQRCNRNLKQQLDDDRFFYQREKEHFCEEMQHHKTCKRSDTNLARMLQRQEKESKEIRFVLEEENRKLREEVLSKSETTYNLCIKFLRMKHAKDILREKLDQVLREHLQAMTDMMEKSDEAREELNIIVSEKFQDPLHLSKAKFLQIVQRNSRLVYENATLKLQVYQLSQNIEKMKSESRKKKVINVDARTIEKLAMQGQRRKSREPIKSVTSASTLDNSEKQVSPSSSVHVSCCLSMGNSGDAKVTAPHQTKQDVVIDEAENYPQRLMKTLAVHTQSAPEIVQTTTFKQDSMTTNRSQYADVIDDERSVEVRDMYTNT